MGSSARADLIFGCDFSDDDGFRVTTNKGSGEVDGDDFTAPWYDSGCEVDAVDQAILALYRSIEDAPPAEYDFERVEIVKERLGVWFVWYGSDDWCGYLLAARTAGIADDWTPVPVDMKALDEPIEDAASRLAHALSVLGVKLADGAQPCWMLVPSYG